MTTASRASVKKPARKHPPHLSHWACGAPPVEIRLVTIGCTCMVQGGELSTGKGSCTINTRGILDCATLFVLHGGRRRESCSSGLLHGEMSSW